VKTFLHVGCGIARKADTTRGFDNDDWRELRLDIDAELQPDIIGSMTDMKAVPDASCDAVFSSHNIEHLYPHEVPVALAEFRRVLRPTGFVVITCPDLQVVAEAVAAGRLVEPLYTSPSGPVAAIDIIYGHRPALAAGKLYMAHRCGFTEQVLVDTLRNAGFGGVASRRWPDKRDLWAVASREVIPEADLRHLAAEHFPFHKRGV
jgi:SAM-dependent methyltransferase